MQAAPCEGRPLCIPGALLTSSLPPSWEVTTERPLRCLLLPASKGPPAGEPPMASQTSSWHEQWLVGKELD